MSKLSFTDGTRPSTASKLRNIKRTKHLMTNARLFFDEPLQWHGNFAGLIIEGQKTEELYIE